MTTLEYILNKYGIVLDGKKMPVDIPNTDRSHSLTGLWKELGFKVGAEIGVEQGIFSKQILEGNPVVKLFCVDAWQAYHGYREHVNQEKLNSFYEITKQRTSGHDCILVRKFSVDAARDFKDGSLDFVYIDANHEFSQVVADLSAWVPKVRIGGIISGHDFLRRKPSGYQVHVVEAVYGYTSAYRVSPWFLLGAKEFKDGELRDRPRSYMWVRQ